MLIKQRTWRGEIGAAVPGGKEAEDIALDAISYLLTGTRVWNPKTHPDLLRFLLAAVRSEVYSLVVSRSNQDVRQTADSPEKGKRDDGAEVLEILDYVKDEPDLYQFVDCIIDGYRERADIAAHLHLELTEVDNLRRRMKRRLDAFYRI